MSTEQIPRSNGLVHGAARLRQDDDRWHSSCVCSSSGEQRTCSTATCCGRESAPTWDSAAPTRDRNVQRVGELARLLADAGIVAVVALVSPCAATRRVVRAGHRADGLTFLEVFVNAPLSLCTERDPKGMYAKARTGELHSFTGVDHPYEPPRSPDVELTPGLCVAEVVDAVLRALGDGRV